MRNAVILSKDDETWVDFCRDWHSQCAEFDEDFETFAEGTFSVIRKLIDAPEKLAAVVGIKSETGYVAICQINTKLIKGYEEPVLRVRHLTMAPTFDFGDASIQEYARVLVDTFFGILDVSDEHATLKARHLKFHLRSVADQQFFAAIGEGLNKSDVFASVHTQGAWLYVTKA